MHGARNTDPFFHERVVGYEVSQLCTLYKSTRHAQETHRERLGQLPMEVRPQETDINFLVWDVEAARVTMPLAPYAQANRLHHLTRLGVSWAIPIRSQLSIVDKPGEAESQSTVSVHEPIETGGVSQACVISTSDAKPALACASGGSIVNAFTFAEVMARRPRDAKSKSGRTHLKMLHGVLWNRTTAAVRHMPRHAANKTPARIGGAPKSARESPHDNQQQQVCGILYQGSRNHME